VLRIFKGYKMDIVSDKVKEAIDPLPLFHSPRHSPRTAQNAMIANPRLAHDFCLKQEKKLN
jgi:hypothetical protein